MNQTKNFAKTLYIVSLVCFYGCLATIASIYFFSLILSSHGETMVYPLSVNIKSETADTIVSSKKGSKERIHSLNQLSMYRQKTYDVMKDPSYRKALVAQRLAIYNNKSKDISSQFTKTLYPDNLSKGEILIAPKDPVFSSIVTIRYYLTYLLAAFIFWQISRFFKALGENFSFHINLNRAEDNCFHTYRLSADYAYPEPNYYALPTKSRDTHICTNN